MDQRIIYRTSTTISGRRLTRKQIAEVQEAVVVLPGDSRSELAQTVCEHLGWVTRRIVREMPASMRAKRRLGRTAACGRLVHEWSSQRYNRAVNSALPLSGFEIGLSGEIAELGRIQGPGSGEGGVFVDAPENCYKPYILMLLPNNKFVRA